MVADRVPANNGNNVGVYMRVSGEDQKQQGTIENQRLILERHLVAHDISPYDWYEDEAWSGYSVPFAQRPSGRRLMEDVKAGRVQTVLVRKLDRFGRNAREILIAVHELESAGAHLVSLKENVDTHTSAGRFFLTVLAGVAELERDMIVERTDEGMTRRLTETAWMGGIPPYGFRVEGKRRDARLALRDEQDEDDTSGYSEVDVVRLMWHLLVEQDWTTEDIAARLGEMGIPSRKRARWVPGVVYRILTDPLYTGTLTYRAKDGTEHTHAVPAILTKEQHARARAKLAEHRRYARTRATGSHPYLLRGLIRCNECKELYTTSWSNWRSGHKHRYYACSTRHYRSQFARASRDVPHECIGESVDAEKLEALIWNDIMRWIENPGEALHEIAARLQEDGSEYESIRHEAAQTQEERDALQARRDKLFTLHLTGLMTETDLAHQIAVFNEEEVKLRSKAEKYEAKLRKIEEKGRRLESARALLQRLHARIHTEPMTPELQREIVETLVDEIVVHTAYAGLSVRKRPKYRAKVCTVYCFDKPDAELEDGMHLHELQDDSTLPPNPR